MKLRTILFACALILSACNIAVTSFPAAQTQPTELPTEVPPTPSPELPTPVAIDAPVVKTPTLSEIHFLDDLDGWGITETQIVRTNDGGMTWYNVTPPDVNETGSTVATFFLDAQHAWVQKPDFNNFP